MTNIPGLSSMDFNNLDTQVSSTSYVNPTYVQCGNKRNTTIRGTQFSSVIIAPCTVPLKCNVAHTREFLSSNEHVSSRLTSLH